MVTTGIAAEKPTTTTTTTTTTTLEAAAPPIAHFDNDNSGGGAANHQDEPQPQSSSYPEGGTQAYLVLLGAWCAMIPPMGLLNTLSPLQAWLTTPPPHPGGGGGGGSLSLSLSYLPESTTAWIFSVYAFLLTFGAGQVGPLFDAAKPHKPLYTIVLPGSVGMVASLVLLSFSRQFWHVLLSFGVLGGVSASMLFNPALSVIGHWFCERRATATGLACTAGGLGGIGFSLVLQYLGPRVGFSWAVRVMALVSAVVLGVATLTMRKRLDGDGNGGNGGSGGSGGGGGGVAAGEEATTEGEMKGNRKKLLVDFGLFRDVKFAVTVCAVFCIEFAVFIPYSYLSSYGLAHGLGLQKAFLLNVVLNVGAIPGRLLPGYAADTVGAFNTICVTALACTLFILGLWQTSGGDEAKIMAFTAIFGFWSGAAISLSPVCVSRVCKIEDIGKCTGMAYFVASFGALVGIPIAGALLSSEGLDDDDEDPYRRLIYFGGAMYGAAFIVFCIARGVAGGWKWAKF